MLKIADELALESDNIDEVIDILKPEVPLEEIQREKKIDTLEKQRGEGEQYNSIWKFITPQQIC